MTAVVGRAGQVVLPVLIALLITVAGAAPAWAHAQLLSSSPSEGEVLAQAPEQVEFDFNEPVTLVDGSVRLFSGDDDPVTLDATVTGTTLIAELPERDMGDGGYAVSYRVISADTHPVSGAVNFSVGEEAAAPSPQLTPGEDDSATTVAVSVLTALQYLGLLAFAGLVLFSVLVTGYRTHLSPRLRRISGVAGLLAVASAALLIPVTAINTVGGGPGALTDVGAWASAIPDATVLAAAVVLVAVVLVGVTTSGRPSRAQRVLAVVAALTGLSTPVLIGHTQVMEPRALIIAADLGHLWAGAVWVGGIIGLLIMLGRTRRPDAGEITDTARIVARFSRLAAWSVLVLVVSGVTMAVIILDDLTALIDSAWGWVLLAKIVLLLPVLGMAAYNRFRLVPALGEHTAPQSRWAILTRTLVAEAVLLGVIITATGFLTNLEPRSVAADASQPGSATPVEFSGQGQGMQVTGEIAPGAVGENTLTFVLDHSGASVPAEDVTLTATLPEQDLGPLEFTPEIDPATDGYRATVTLPVAGEWSFRVGARVSTFSEPLVTITTSVE